MIARGANAMKTALAPFPAVKTAKMTAHERKNVVTAAERGADWAVMPKILYGF